MKAALNNSGATDGRVAAAMDLAEIPAGEFWMGCETGRADESPVHQVYVDAFRDGFYNQSPTSSTKCLPRLPVKWYLRLSVTPCFNNPCQPVVAVTWCNAMAYCSWLSRETGLSFRLPTEAEWEWAVRDGRDKALYAWGNDLPETLEDGLAPAGGKWALTPSPFIHRITGACYDLGDNVHEWCFDWYDPEYYSRAPRHNPVNLFAPQPGGHRAEGLGDIRSR